MSDTSLGAAPSNGGEPKDRRPRTAGTSAATNPTGKAGRGRQHPDCAEAPERWATPGPGTPDPHRGRRPMNSRIGIVIVPGVRNTNAQGAYSTGVVEHTLVLTAGVGEMLTILGAFR